MNSRSLFSSFVASIALIQVLRANVLVVDAAGTGYIQIQPAVDAAVDGDTILVKSGSYDSFVVHNKSLSVVGDTGSDVNISGAIRASDLPAGKTLLFENLTAHGVAGSTISAYGLYLSTNHGHVRVEACHFIGGQSPLGTSYSGIDGIRVEACNDVVLTRTTSLGGSGGIVVTPGESPSGSGLTAKTSAVAIYDSTLQGGTGDSADPSAFDQDGGGGGNGCSLGPRSWLFASGTNFFAGNGGGGGYGGSAFVQTWGGDGGDGIILDYATNAVLLDDVFVLGSGGHAGFGPDSNQGDEGHARFTQYTNSSFTDLLGTSKHFIAPTPIRENAIATLSFSGTPGDAVTLLIARQPGFHYDATQSGVFLLGGPIRAVSLGVVPVSGTFTAQIPISTLGPGLDSIVLHLQAQFEDPQGNHVLSGPSSLVILNQAF